MRVSPFEESCVCSLQDFLKAARCGLRLVAGGWLVLVRGGGACRAVGGGLQSGAALIDVRLDVGPLPPRSSSPTVAGCRLGGFPAGRDRWGGERVVGGVLPRINICADVWGESSIMKGVFQRWCSSTLHFGWSLCDRLCLAYALRCRGY